MYMCVASCMWALQAAMGGGLAGACPHTGGAQPCDRAVAVQGAVSQGGHLPWPYSQVVPPQHHRHASHFVPAHHQLSLSAAALHVCVIIYSGVCMCTSIHVCVRARACVCVRLCLCVSIACESGYGEREGGTTVCMCACLDVHVCNRSALTRPACSCSKSYLGSTAQLGQVLCNVPNNIVVHTFGVSSCMNTLM